MDRGFDVPWVGGHNTTGKGITILKVEFQFSICCNNATHSWESNYGFLLIFIQFYTCSKWFVNSQMILFVINITISKITKALCNGTFFRAQCTYCKCCRCQMVIWSSWYFDPGVKLHPWYLDPPTETVPPRCMADWTAMVYWPPESRNRQGVNIPSIGESEYHW